MPWPDTTGGGFAATHWSLVARARDSDDVAAQAALLSLCLRYWYPVFAYLRRSGHAAEAAHALARKFFDSLARFGSIQEAAARHGRFRLFILSELHRFLSAAHPPAAPGAGHPQDLAPPLQEMEARHRAQARPGDSPEQLLGRGFAVEILGSARTRLRREAREAGRLEMFETLERFLGIDPNAGDCEALARRLAMRPLSVAMAVKRLRQRFRELVDDELAETLSSPGDLEAERQALLRALEGDPG